MAGTYWPYVASLVIVLWFKPGSIERCLGERNVVHEARLLSWARPLGKTQQKRRMTPGHTVDRVEQAVDGADVDMAQDSGMWRPNPPGLKDRCRWARRPAAAQDVGGGDRFDLTTESLDSDELLGTRYGRATSNGRR